MKKVIFMMAVASVMLSSCSSEEPVKVNEGRAIEFRQNFTRAASYANDNLMDDFIAYAFVGTNSYFADVTFTGTDGTYSSATPYYWPGDGSTVNFKAFAPSDLSGTVAVTNNNVTVTGFTVANDIAAQQDFVLGTASGSKANEGTGVQLDFTHMLSQIEVKAITANTTYTFAITGVKIAYIQNKGNYDGSAATKWTVAEGSSKYSYTELYNEDPIVLDPEATEAVSLMANGGNAILLPQELTAWVPAPEATEHNTAEGAYLAVKLKVTAADGAVQIYPFERNGEISEWAAIPLSGTWMPGYKYTYILDFTSGAGRVDPDNDVDPDQPIFGEPINFTVKVTPWTPEADNTLNM